MGNKVMPNEVLYHIGISAEMLKGAEYALCCLEIQGV